MARNMNDIIATGETRGEFFARKRAEMRADLDARMEARYGKPDYHWTDAVPYLHRIGALSGCCAH